MPGLMSDMLEQKVGDVRAGVSTARVPSPTATTLHALNYHRIDAFEAHRALPALPADSLDTLLRIPLAGPGDLARTELEKSVQSILGCVARRVDQGIGLLELECGRSRLRGTARRRRPFARSRLHCGAASDRGGRGAAGRPHRADPPRAATGEEACAR